MTIRARFIIAVLWALSLVAVGVMASAQAQFRVDPAPGDVISGSDIGFRPDGWRGKARTGTWVVRINGEWVEAADSFRPHPATTP
jgi:hypothetical protein